MIWDIIFIRSQILFVVIERSAFLQIRSEDKVKVGNSPPPSGCKCSFSSHSITFPEPLRCCHIRHARKNIVTESIFKQFVESACGMLELSHMAILVCSQQA